MKEIFARRSIRKYTERQVEQEKIQELLRAAMCAPSAGNERPWHFIVIDNPEMLRRLPGEHPTFQMLAFAPSAIMVCGDTLAQKYPEDYWIQDCAAATQNILIEAQYLGLGCVWLGIYPTDSTIREFQAYLGLPGNIIPFSLIPIGYPATPKRAKDRYDASKVHINGW